MNLRLRLPFRWPRTSPPSLPFFGSPLRDDEAPPPHPTDAPKVTSPTVTETTSELSVRHHPSGHEEESPGPHFSYHEESTAIELFYDLFFVANLGTFTDLHKIDDGPALSSYIAYFVLLWSTWFQSTLFDVRFSTRDSLFARACTAVHFFVMAGFAAVARSFYLDDHPDRSEKAFRALCLVLLVSRVVLILQYGRVMWVVWRRDRRWRGTFWGLALGVGVLSVAAAVYLGLFFAFERHSRLAFIGWFLLVPVETLSILFIPSVGKRWRSLSFEQTHLGHRVGLLTIIILGEGVIGIARAINNVAMEEEWSAAIVGQIASAVLIVYFLWTLYFDPLKTTPRTSAPSTPVWTLLHLPLHIALVLCVESIAQFITWRHAVESLRSLSDLFTKLVNISPTGPILATHIETAIETFYATFRVYPSPARFAEMTRQLGVIRNVTGSVGSLESTDSNPAINATDQIASGLAVSLFASYGIEVPHATFDGSAAAAVAAAVGGDGGGAAGDGGGSSSIEELESIANVFGLVFEYCFIATGCAVILLGVVGWMARRRHSLPRPHHHHSEKPHRNTSTTIKRYNTLSLLLRTAIGLGLALLATFVAGPNERVFSAFIFSPWILPTILLALVLVVVLEWGVRIWGGKRG
ncbi:MAG: hypothetical protein M1817_000767 [Caeruleum heppii]|nr:MAG: hypothetical protein M1817_000767 [Caeruleum heppii]